MSRSKTYCYPKLLLRVREGVNPGPKRYWILIMMNLQNEDGAAYCKFVCMNSAMFQDIL